ncbi:MAG: hypothetical protein P1V97_21270 [Planctomycetota bacterium]|nr:hypothetical protein [Planctomycetota bacterium]
MKSRLGPDNEALIELTLMDDEGRFKNITALIDTGWSGELYLGHFMIREMRLRPGRFQKTWIEQNPEPMSAVVGTQQCPVWQGTVALKDEEGKIVKVQQGLRGHSEQARVGRAFLKRFGILLILDIEGNDYQVLARNEG